MSFILAACNSSTNPTSVSQPESEPQPIVQVPLMQPTLIGINEQDLEGFSGEFSQISTQGVDHYIQGAQEALLTLFTLRAKARGSWAQSLFQI